MEQFTVNLLAEMGAQPGSLEAGLDGRDAVDRHDPADLDDHLAESGRNDFQDGTQRDDRRYGDGRRRAAWWPESKSRPTTARPGIRRP